MEFEPKRAIYLQIGDYVCENILSGTWKAGDRIPSVREMAVSLEVNPNTVMRSYSYLQESGIIANQRGLGYFVGERSREAALGLKRQEFAAVELKRVFRTMELLGFGIDDLKGFYESYRKA